ncbi:hypothetical protein ACFO1V_12015 [Daeguia caeni]|uniref:Uncharacterized protein n=1 Tax=Daeguia caeni TaxID=439612 RepID=A0ABV9H9C4_9HYPH
MKHQRRPLVVEYKGRRSRKPNRPLWDKLDLQTIVHEVMQQPAEEFSTKPVVIETGTVPSVPSQSARQPKILPSINNLIPSVHSSPSQSSENSVLAKAQDTERPRRSKPRHNRHVMVKSGQKEDDKVQTRIVDASLVDEGDLDELDALEAMNIRLKRMLIEKLREENAMMRAMLARIPA